MLSYLTLDGVVLNLSHLTDQERAFFDRCRAAARDGMAYDAFRAFINGPENPLLAAPNRRITAAVWQHPLYQAVRDLGDRLAIRQGELAAEPGDDVDRDPTIDVWLPVAEAAKLRGVAVSGLHKAIDRGAVVAAPRRPGGTWLLVSRNSLERWAPSTVRQAAGRHRALVSIEDSTSSLRDAAPSAAHPSPRRRGRAPGSLDHGRTQPATTARSAPSDRRLDHLL
jgi:hypothetical protein